MEIDREAYIPNFIDEARENIRTAESRMFDLRAGVSPEDGMAVILRALHTLKGSSRMLGFKRIEALSHALESAFAAARDERACLSENAVKLMLSAFDALKTALSSVGRAGGDDAPGGADIEKALAAFAQNEEFSVPRAGARAPGGDGREAQNEDAPESGESGAAGKSAGVPRHIRSEYIQKEYIRLPLDKIEGVVKDIASLRSLEPDVKNIARDMAALHEEIKRFSKTAREEKRRGGAPYAAACAMERLAAKAALSLKHYALDAGGRAKAAYDAALSLRMLPLSTILDRYPRFCFELACDLGKKVRLSVEDGGAEADKHIVAALHDALTHIIRNAIDHGIESPEERVKAGKDETGAILIRCSADGGGVKITVSDDGRGIDYEKIRKKAVELGFIGRADAATEETLAAYMFRSGFSTARETGLVSGRGFGLDAAAADVERIKGGISVESEPGRGASFVITAPISIAALSGFPVSSGGRAFVIPAGFVDTVLHIGEGDIMTVVDRPAVRCGGRVIRLFYLRQILGLPPGARGSRKERAEEIFVLIIRIYDEFLALALDGISAMRPVVVKPLPACMEKLGVFSGLAPGDGRELVPVIHVPALIRMARRLKPIDIKKRYIEHDAPRKSALVADDSRATREVICEILRGEGYRADAAANGAEALEAAKTKHYDLICTDIDMPVMDGLMLTENIRGDEDLARVPVVIISSRLDGENRRRARACGADRFIAKNAFSAAALIDAARELAGSAHG